MDRHKINNDSVLSVFKDSEFSNLETLTLAFDSAENIEDFQDKMNDSIIYVMEAIRKDAIKGILAYFPEDSEIDMEFPEIRSSEDFTEEEEEYLVHKTMDYQTPRPIYLYECVSMLSEVERFKCTFEWEEDYKRAISYISLPLLRHASMVSLALLETTEVEQKAIQEKAHKEKSKRYGQLGQQKSYERWHHVIQFAIQEAKKIWASNPDESNHQTATAIRYKIENNLKAAGADICDRTPVVQTITGWIKNHRPTPARPGRPKGS